MSTSRVFRLAEGTLVVLFFIQASRAVFAYLLSLLTSALAEGQIGIPVIIACLVLIFSTVLCWLAPRSRSVLPANLLWAGILVAVARLVMASPFTGLRYYAAVLVMGLGGVYYVSLLRANWRTWIASVVTGLAIDQLLRAYNTFDISQRVFAITFEIPLSLTEVLPIRMSWMTIQFVLSGLLVLLSLSSRRRAFNEPYEPADLNALSGLAIGGFFASQVVVLAVPNTAARWTEIPASGLVVWMLLATVLPLLPASRRIVTELLAPFADRLRGLVWLLFMLLMLVIGNLLNGIYAAYCLVLAQFMAVFLLWWTPIEPDPGEPDQVAPSVSLALLTFVLLVGAYSFTFEFGGAQSFLRGQALIVVLVAGILMGLPRLFAVTEDPWLVRSVVPRGLAAVFIAPIVTLGLVVTGFSRLPAQYPAAPTFSIATYNINSGFSLQGEFQLEVIARTIEASGADIIVLQEVDTGRPVSYSVDQVQFLANRLGMHSIYRPTVEQVHGLAILSRWPVFEPQTAFLPPGDTSEQPFALSVIVQDQTTGRTVRVIGGLLAPGDEQNRIQQYGSMLSLIVDDELNLPAVLALDLGTSENDIVYEQIVFGAGYVDPNAQLGITEGFTYPADQPSVRQDFVFTKGLTPLASRQVESTASDHRLVVVEVAWPQ